MFDIIRICRPQNQPHAGVVPSHLQDRIQSRPRLQRFEDLSSRKFPPFHANQCWRNLELLLPSHCCRCSLNKYPKAQTSRRGVSKGHFPDYSAPSFDRFGKINTEVRNYHRQYRRDSTPTNAFTTFTAVLTHRSLGLLLTHDT